ncbi:DNA/RNA non-specific endonuclease [Lysobacter antibioticus]|uniref:DNA/RNA non-specific endonuclease n=1 Tax=Lysobacter antibioticus TaxID=84531 RepID=UPI0005649E5E|nr:DNA/RNA non-specific endonuclease [Lysobacter antibioticus]
MTDPISPNVRLNGSSPGIEPPAASTAAQILSSADPAQARGVVDALTAPQLSGLRSEVEAMPVAERETLANELAGKLDAPQLRKLEAAFGRDGIAAAVDRRSGPEVRAAYAEGAGNADDDGLIGRLKDWLGLSDRARGETEEISATVVNPDTGEVNDARWTVDDEGRPIHAEGTLRTVFSGIERSDDETQAQRTAADRGVEGDQGGHVFGHRFVTDQGLKNLFPQNGNFNMGAYKTLENEWAAWVDKGMDVRISIDLSPREADRPDRVRISYDVIDPADGGRVYDQRVTFENRAGQSYDRVDVGQMDDLIAAAS